MEPIESISDLNWFRVPVGLKVPVRIGVSKVPFTCASLSMSSREQTFDLQLLPVSSGKVFPGQLSQVPVGLSI